MRLVEGAKVHLTETWELQRPGDTFHYFAAGTPFTVEEYTPADPSVGIHQATLVLRHVDGDGPQVRPGARLELDDPDLWVVDIDDHQLRWDYDPVTDEHVAPTIVIN